MARYKVVAARCEVGDGGMTPCGPIFGPVIGEIHLQGDNGEDFFLCDAEVEGIPNIYKTPMSTIDDQLSASIFDNGEKEAFFHSCYVDGTDDYEELLSNKEDEFYDAYRYLTYIVRASWEDTKAFIEKTAGKYLDEMDIPMSDIEEDYLEEYDEEDEYDEEK